jgi:formate hydrogenlyase subunit 3/multisubunit Na+/H+ antiporter MnhD subunit
VIVADTSSAAGAAIAVVWLAAAAFALRSAEPKSSRFPLASATMSGAMLSTDILNPPSAKGTTSY